MYKIYLYRYMTFYMLFEILKNDTRLKYIYSTCTCTQSSQQQKLQTKLLMADGCLAKVARY